MKLECTGKEFLEILFDMRCNKCPMVIMCHRSGNKKEMIYDACMESGEKIQERLGDE